MNVLASGEVHYGVTTPADRPGHLLHLLFDGGAECGVADIGVDLGQEVTADDHRLQLGVVDIGRDDRPPACHLVTNKFGGDALRDRGTEVLALVLLQQSGILYRLQFLVLADGDKLHLRSNDPLARIVHLADIVATPGTTRLSLLMEAEVGQRWIGGTLLTIVGTQATQHFGIIAIVNPGGTQRIQPLTQIDLDRRIREGASGIVDMDLLIGGEGDLAHRHADIGAAPLDIDLLRLWKRLYRNITGLVNACVYIFGSGTHGWSFCFPTPA